MNINQIAHRLNSNIGDMRDAEYVVELMKELNVKLEKLTEKKRNEQLTFTLRNEYDNIKVIEDQIMPGENVMGIKTKFNRYNQKK